MPATSKHLQNFQSGKRETWKFAEYGIYFDWVRGSGVITTSDYKRIPLPLAASKLDARKAILDYINKTYVV